MNGTRKLGLVAAAASLLAAAPLSAIFAQWTWLIQSILLVVVLAGVALLARSVQAPPWAQGLAMTIATLVALAWLFPSGEELLGFVPTPGTFAYFGELLSQSVQDMRSYGVPVPDTDPLLFIAVGGVGLVTIVVDLLTVGLRRPALAGLPMLAVYSVPVAVYTDSVSPVPFAVGAVGFLWLLAADNLERVRRFGRRFTGEGRDVDIWEPSPLSAAGRRLGIVGIAVALLLPIAIPGMTDGMLNDFNGIGAGGNGTGNGGSPGRINLFAALSGQLNQSEVHEMVKVTTSDPNPFYLRFGVADVLRSDGFGVRYPSGQAVTRRLPDPRERARPGLSYQQFHASVEITSDFDMPLLPVYADPIRTDGLDSAWLYDPVMEIIFSHHRRSKKRTYAFDYVRARYTPSVLRATGALPADHPFREQFTSVPFVREVDELVTRLTKGKKTEYDKTRAIYDYFSHENGFTYRLRTEGGTSGKDIVDFLNNKAGFCQQYAAAMAWMVRTAGIPARVAFGFTNGSEQDGNTYTLTNLNLHAWTEVYFEGVGWVPFDPTPAAAVPGSTRSAWAPDTEAPEPITPSTPASAAPGGNSSPGTNPQDRHERDIGPGLPGAGGPAGPRAPTWPWWAAFGVIGLLALLALPGLQRTALRRRRRARTLASAAAARVADGSAGARVVVAADERTRAEAHAAWDELLDTLVDFRIRVDATETPRATAERLVTDGHTVGPTADAVRVLARTEERARYARDPLREERLPTALAAVRRAIAAGARRRDRVWALLLPPSVLQRWRLAVMDTSALFVAGLGRTRGRLLRASVRRLSPRRTVRAADR